MKPRWGLIIASILLATLVLRDSSAHAQPAPRIPARIAWVSVFPLSQVASYLDAFRSGLAAEGYVEGRDVEVLARSANGNPERLPAVVEEVLALRPDVIVSQGAAIFGLRTVTRIPIVYGFSGDPIAADLTDSMARPGGNLTGVSFMTIELNAKRLDILRTVAPQTRRVILMGDPVHPGVDLEVAANQETARQLGMEMRWVPTRNVREVSAFLASLDQDAPDALVILPDSVMLESREQVSEYALRHKIPAISGWSMFAHSGGLLTYGPRLSESFKRLAYYAVRILKGAKPSDLPIERPTQFELVISLKTARQIGLAVPDSLIALADEVVE